MYKPGQWHAHCDVCGFKYYSGEMRQRWDGLMVCAKDWEPDHPQKYLRVPTDTQSVPWVREQTAELDVSPFCDIWTTSPMAGFGTADCARVGGNTSVDFLIDLYYPNTSSVALIAISGYSISGVI